MTTAILAKATYLFFTILEWTLIVRILLTWFPNVNWYNQPFKVLKDITDPILLPFRGLIPPLGGIDFSPIIAFLLIGVIREMILRFLIVI